MPSERPNQASDRPAILGGPMIRPSGPPAWPRVNPEISAIMHQLAESGEWGRYHGRFGPELKQTLQQAYGTEFVTLCSSGTAAIELCLVGAGVRPGDEVILSAYDFKSNLTNILTLQARPVLVDARPEDGQMDVSQLDRAFSEKTRAVLVSHLHGGLAEMPTLCEWADARGIVVIEDVCQAPGAVLQSRPAGTWGHCAALSFGGSKLLTAGRGGAVLCSSAEIAQRVKLYNERGNTAYPLSEIQAAILIPQVHELPSANRKRHEAVSRLRDLLGAESGLLLFPEPSSASIPSYYKLGMLYLSEQFQGMSRELFTKAMRAEGIALDPGLPALHETHARSRFRAVTDLEQTTRFAKQVVTLHHPVLLGSESDLREIADAVGRLSRFAGEIRETCEPV